MFQQFKYGFPLISTDFHNLFPGLKDSIGNTNSNKEIEVCILLSYFYAFPHIIKFLYNYYKMSPRS